MEWREVVMELLFKHLLYSNKYSVIKPKKCRRFATGSQQKVAHTDALLVTAEKRKPSAPAADNAYERMKEEEEKIRKNSPVYMPSEKQTFDFSYVFVPDGVQVKRVAQTQLGYGVLGMAFPGLKLIYVLETLHGNDFDEVLKHERNHIMHPWMTEQEVRFRTKNELYFEARYH